MEGTVFPITRNTGSILYQHTDWNVIDATRHPGESGEALWKTLQYPGLRIRIVEYSENYKADHWCRKGHVVYCLEGEMTSELSDGRIFTLTAGMSYQVSDNMSMHRTHSRTGVKLLIIDGDFLNTPIEKNPWRM